jgi:hypothetical protein
MDNQGGMQGLRYLAYVAFAVGAFIFWALFYMLVLGFFPFPAEPACSLEPGGCPPPSVWEQLLNIVVIFGTIPLTVFIFLGGGCGRGSVSKTRCSVCNGSKSDLSGWCPVWVESGHSGHNRGE